MNDNKLIVPVQVFFEIQKKAEKVLSPPILDLSGFILSEIEVVEGEESGTQIKITSTMLNTPVPALHKSLFIYH